MSSIPSYNSNQQQTQQQQFYQNQQNSNNSVAGPPTTGLFDYLRNEKSFQTPQKNLLSPQQTQNFSSQQQSFMSPPLNASGFNQSRIMSPISNLAVNNDFNNSYSQHHNSTFQTSVSPPLNGFVNNVWITVFGFQQSATTSVLSHFSQCGTILEKVCSSGNWMHLKYSSRIECDKALLYNGKIICNNLMVGVMRCNDESVLEKENNAGQNRDKTVRIRSLTQAAYNSAQEPTEVSLLSPLAPKRTTGIFNKTLDLFFGW